MCKPSLKKRLDLIKVHYNLTISTVKMFVNVRNNVTTRVTLPGIAVKGIKKLIIETRTIVIHGM